MGWLLLGLLLGLLVGAAALAAVMRAVGRVTGTGPRGVGRLILDGLAPGRRTDGVAAQRALARRLKRTGERTASGRRVAADELVVHVSPEDHDAIDAALGMDTAEADLTRFYVDHASNSSWIVNGTPVVHVERDISLRPRQAFVRAVHRAARPAVAERPRPEQHRPQPEEVREARPATGPTPVADRSGRPPSTGRIPVVDGPLVEDRPTVVHRPPPPLSPDEAVTDVLPRGLLEEEGFRTAVYPAGGFVGDLTVVHGTEVRTVTAAEGALRIGRGPHNDLVLNRPGVGRDHLVLEVRDGTWWAVPGTAPGGTLLDGARVEEAVPLHGTALLELGRGVRIRVSVEGG
jgi:hypothetical protein